ncbi:hypothetical protein Pcinc_002163 [Petrolisthes cinctipes]|uniref:Uncharacterized protein n=1 Tax=Petrolisthes cinctipes TaxID=88211 RepID=A0AAE1GLH9_PETCI|nr:hypothetical protein Pcinc_002163 [Petrolisthes cinctipes]
MEYCSPVWWLAADCHLKLLDRIGSNANSPAGCSLDCNLSHLHSVASLCMLFMIRSNVLHSLNSSLPPLLQPVSLVMSTPPADRDDTVTKLHQTGINSKRQVVTLVTQRHSPT